MVEEEKYATLNKIKTTNFSINVNYLGSTQFENEELERNYAKENSKTEKFYDMLANMMMVLGYISYGIYLLIVFPREILIKINLLCFALSVSIYLYHLYSKNFKISKFYVDQVLILISYLNTLGKIYYVLFIMENEQEKHSTEILRCMFYSFLSTYLYILMKIENCFNTYAFYMITHLSVAFLSESHSKISHFYYVEWAFGAMLGFIFLYIRKLWEVNKRYAYSEKKRFDILFNFVKDMLRNLNSTQVSTENSEILNEK